MDWVALMRPWFWRVIMQHSILYWSIFIIIDCLTLIFCFWLFLNLKKSKIKTNFILFLIFSLFYINAIMIYFGNNHINKMIPILEEIGFNIQHSYESRDQCIILKGLSLFC